MPGWLALPRDWLDSLGGIARLCGRTMTAKPMALNIVLVHLMGMMGTLAFWGANPRAPIGG